MSASPLMESVRRCACGGDPWCFCFDDPYSIDWDYDYTDSGFTRAIVDVAREWGNVDRPFNPADTFHPARPSARVNGDVHVAEEDGDPEEKFHRRFQAWFFIAETDILDNECAAYMAGEDITESAEDLWTCSATWKSAARAGGTVSRAVRNAENASLAAGHTPTAIVHSE